MIQENLTSSQWLVSKNTLENIMLLTLIFFYSFSSPWPQTMSFFEIIIMCLLVGFLYRTFLPLIIFSKPLTTFIFLTLLFIPLFVGLFMHSNDIIDIVRDIIPFLYLCIPMCFFLIRREQKQLQYLLKRIPFFICFAGVIFSLRELYHFMGNFHLMSSTSEHLMQAPLSIFTALFLLLKSVDSFCKHKIFQFILFLSLALLPLSTFYFTILRAPIGFIILGLIFFLLLSIEKYKITLLIIFISMLFIIIFFSDDILILFESFIHKTEVYGSNHKTDEFFTVLHTVFFQENISMIFLGKGWGATWYTAAGAGFVRFAHSLLVYSMLKMGLLGVLAFFIFFSHLSYIVVSIIRTRLTTEQWILLISLCATLFINIWFEPGFKTLDFSILLLLLYILKESNTIQSKKTIKDYE